MTAGLGVSVLKAYFQDSEPTPEILRRMRSGDELESARECLQTSESVGPFLETVTWRRQRSAPNYLRAKESYESFPKKP